MSVPNDSAAGVSDAAPERVYFSNGTEGAIWMAQWCDRCANDHSTHHPNEDWANGCWHILSMLAHTDDPVLIGGEYPDPMVCVEFSRCACDNGPDDPPGPEPTPPPDPNQGLLFDVDEVAMGVRMGPYLDAMRETPVVVR